MDAPATTALANRWTLESSQRRDSPIWPLDTGQTCGCERALRRGAGRSWLCIHQSTYSAHPGRRVVILEPWYAVHFRTHTLSDRLPNSFGVLFSLGYNHVMASLLGCKVRILLLAEFQKDQSNTMDFSSLSEQSLITSRLYLRAGSSLMIRTGHVGAKSPRHSS